MLQFLDLENFKSWRSVHLEFGQITGLFGTNSSGKSSLLQFILLLKQSREAGDPGVVLELNGPYVDVGVFSDVIYCHDQRLTLSWRLAVETDFPEPDNHTVRPELRGGSATVFL